MRESTLIISKLKLKICQIPKLKQLQTDRMYLYKLIELINLHDNKNLTMVPTTCYGRLITLALFFIMSV